MFNKNTFKLGMSILGSAIISIILSFIFVITFGTIGAASSNASSSAVSSGASSAGTAAKSAAQATAGIIDYPAGRILIGVICVLIYLGLIYSTAWREGDKDPNRVKYGHIKKCMAKGFAASLFTSIPFIIIYAVYLVTNLINPKDLSAIISAALFRATNIQFIVFNSDIVNLPILCFIFLLPLPIISGLGYIAGYKHFSITSKIVYKSKKSTNNAKK